MDPSLEAVRPHIETLCRRLGVRRLDLLRFDDDPDTDVELLADLGDARDDHRDVHAALERHLYGLLGRPVTLVDHAPTPGEPLYES